MRLKTIALTLALGAAAPFALACSNAEYRVFREYDAYLDANPTVDDDTLRSSFARRKGIAPSQLKDLYFRCLLRWKDREPGEARRVGEAAAARVQAGGESSLTLGHSCKTLGYRYGHTATSTMLGKPVQPGWDFEMPARCGSKAETEAAIRDGGRAASR